MINITIESKAHNRLQQSYETLVAANPIKEFFSDTDDDIEASNIYFEFHRGDTHLDSAIYLSFETLNRFNFHETLLEQAKTHLEQTITFEDESLHCTKIYKNGEMSSNNSSLF